MKKIGIAADNYKLEKFREELTAKGFVIIYESPFTKNTTMLKVLAHETQVMEVKTICIAVEAHFNSIKAKQN